MFNILIQNIENYERLPIIVTFPVLVFVTLLKKYITIIFVIIKLNNSIRSCYI